jgi:hypothetical protein
MPDKCSPVARIPVFRHREKGFEDQENMLASYAGDDHRMFKESREGLIQIPDARGQEPRQRVYMATSR